MSAPPDEIFDMAAFRAADDGRRRVVLEAVARAVGGRELMVTASVAEPRRGRSDGRSGGPRLLHRRTGARFCLVPGGTLYPGLSEDEVAVFEDGPFLDGPHADPSAREAVRMLGELTRAAHPVAVAPFLLAEDTLADNDGRTRRLDLDELAAALPAPLRLPSDAEWEHACRAGTDAPFTWGEAVEAPAGWHHPLGLARLFDDDELVAESLVRGGVSRQRRLGRAVWLATLAAWRRPWEPDAPWSAVTVRPALSLPWGAPPLAPRRPVAGRTFQPSRTLASALAELVSDDATTRAAAAEAVWSAAGGAGVWSGQGVVALPRVIDLALARATPDRAALFVLAADLVAGDHSAVAATGLDRSRPAIAEGTASSRAQTMRAASITRLPEVVAVVADRSSDADTRAAAAMLACLLPEAAHHQPRLAAALTTEDDPSVRATLVLGLTLLAGCNTSALSSDPSPVVAGAAALARCGAVAEPDLSAILGFVSATDGGVPWAHGERLGLAARWLLARRPDGRTWVDRLTARHQSHQ